MPEIKKSELEPEVKKPIPKVIETQVDETTLVRKPNPEHPEVKKEKEKSDASN